MPELETAYGRLHRLQTCTRTIVVYSVEKCVARAAVAFGGAPWNEIDSVGCVCVCVYDANGRSKHLKWKYSRKAIRVHGAHNPRHTHREHRSKSNWIACGSECPYCTYDSRNASRWRWRRWKQLAISVPFHWIKRKEWNGLNTHCTNFCMHLENLVCERPSKSACALAVKFLQCNCFEVLFLCSFRCRNDRFEFFTRKCVAFKISSFAE